MGVSCMNISSSCYDKKYDSQEVMNNRINNMNRELTELKEKINESNNKNPNPFNFKITDFIEYNGFLVVYINYPNCTNYEGDKILLYRGISIKDLLNQGSVDPHFSNNKDFYSPVARFEPSEEGMRLMKTLLQYHR